MILPLQGSEQVRAWSPQLHRRALHGFGNRFGVIEVVLLSLAIGADIFGRHQLGIVTKRCEIAAGRRRKLPCRSGKAVHWRAGLPLGHATTFAAARWRRTTWNEFLPISMPITAIAVLDV
jgi:hypothetical protein